MLSAQTRDPVTLEASTRLFAKAPTPEAMVRLSEAQIEKLIYPVSFYRNKAVHVKATCRQLLDEFGGVVPSTMAELLTLPGVGRKTANLVRIVAHRRPDSICVDTHVHRIANRFGWVRTRMPGADRARALRGDREEVVVAHQPLPGHVGPARLQAGLPAVSALPGARPVPAHRRDAGGQGLREQRGRRDRENVSRTETDEAFLRASVSVPRPVRPSPDRRLPR